MRKAVVLLIILIFYGPITAFSHPGRTDGRGGHYNRATGEYHFHHGYPAHQHAGGTCPYDFDDQTNHKTGNKNSSYAYNPAPVLETENNAPPKMSWWARIIAAAGIAYFFGGPLLGTVLFFVCLIVVAFLKKFFPRIKNINNNKVAELIYASILPFSMVVAFVILLFWL